MVGEARVSHGSGWSGGAAAKGERHAKRQKVSGTSSSSFPLRHHEAIHVPPCMDEVLGTVRKEWKHQCDSDDEDDDELEGDDLRKLSRLAWRVSEERQGRGGDEEIKKLSKAFLESFANIQELGVPCMSEEAFIRAFTQASVSRSASASASLFLHRCREASKALFGADGGAHQGIDEQQVAELALNAARCAMMGDSTSGSLAQGPPGEASEKRPARLSSEACLSLLGSFQGTSQEPHLPLAPRALVSSLISLVTMLTLDPRDMKDLETAEKLLVSGLSICGWIDKLEASRGFFPAEDLILPQDQRPLESRALIKLVNERYAMLLCQLGRDEEASAILTSIGYTHRLGRDVLCYKIRHDVSASDDSASDQEESPRFVRVVDNSLPMEMLETMTEAFHPRSSFWLDHGYHLSSPYFSYVHPLSPASKPSSGLDSIIRHIHSVACTLFPAAKEAQFAEWWAHCRPHGEIELSNRGQCGGDLNASCVSLRFGPSASFRL
jgi:hypothetical protein